MNTIKTTIDTANTLPVDIHAAHGESIRIEYRLTNYSKPIITSERLLCTVYYQDTNIDDSRWYVSHNATAISDETGVTVLFFWDASLDGGADAYRYFIRIENGDSISYAIRGNIYLAASPGFTPNEIELPIETLDFNAIKVENAPWVLQDEFDELKAKVDEGNGSSSGDIVSEGDPIFMEWKNANIPNSPGTMELSFNDTGAQMSGDFHFSFDPLMFSRGNIDFSLTFPPWLMPNVAGQTVSYSGMIHLRDSWQSPTSSSPVFVTDKEIVPGLYLYIQVMNLLENKDGTVKLFFMLSGSDDANSRSDTTPFGDAIQSAITSYSYDFGGKYKPITEATLRDRITGVAYTLCVENGNLKIVEFREEQY